VKQFKLSSQPLEATPELKGRDAEEFLAMTLGARLTPEKRAELEKCKELYEKNRPKESK
jgi:hypothetical protein